MASLQREALSGQQKVRSSSKGSQELQMEVCESQGTVEVHGTPYRPKNLVASGSFRNVVSFGSHTSFLVDPTADDASFLSDPAVNKANMSISGAIVVMFCSAFGAGIALVPWYPKLCGTLGMLINLVIVGSTAYLAESSLMDVARQTSAKTFTELCVSLPHFMKPLTEMSSIAWGLTLCGLYIDFVYSALQDQVFDEQANRAVLFACIALAVFASTMPTHFSGPVGRVINNINFVTTWVVIVTAVVKGIVTGTHIKPSEDTREFTTFKFDGFVTVTVLLAGAMMQCPIVPQLCVEISERQRERAAWLVPGFVAALQGSVFMVVSFAGYFALGDAVEGNAFMLYKQTHPDWMVTVLEMGCALLMYLSTPLVLLPAKAQCWSVVVRCFSKSSESTTLSAAPIPMKILLNAAMIICSTALPLVLGSKRFMSFLTIIAGTAANWLNIFLPGFVLLYAKVLPDYNAGALKRRPAVVCLWILVLATICLVSSVFKIQDELFGAASAMSTTSTSMTTSTSTTSTNMSATPG